MEKSNAPLFGFSFATRATDPFDTPSAVQQTRELPVEKNTIKRRAPRRSNSLPRLTLSAASNLTTSGFLELVEPARSVADLVISSDNYKTLAEVVQEVRRRDDLERYALKPRSKVLFCGPPGCGKTLCAEVMAAELRMPLVVARLDAIITTYLGETASNLRKVFDSVSGMPVVLFLDEFDALARSRTDANEHSEIRRVVNSLLMMIDRFSGRGLLIAATNLVQTIDEAAWRRFDEVVLFDRPDVKQILNLLRIKLRNYPVNLEPSLYADRLAGMSYAEIERVCLSAIKRSILNGEAALSAGVFTSAIDSERRRMEVRRSTGS